MHTKKFKSLLALWLTVVLIFTVLPLGSFAAENTACWDGIRMQQPSKLIKIDGIYYYEISTAEEFAFVAQTEGNWRKYNYRLVADIVLNSVELKSDGQGTLINDPTTLNVWKPICDFEGTFDGNGFSVSGLYTEHGLFDESHGKIYNLSVKNAYVSGARAGGICRSSWGEIKNCTFSGTVISSRELVGGLVGFNGGKISNCQNYGSVFLTDTEDSTASGAGGIVGCGSYGDSIDSCQNHGDIYSFGDRVGGVVGWGSVSNSSNYGTVQAQNQVGGICGIGSVSNSSNFGSVQGKTDVGGISGSNGGTFTNTENHGNVTGNTNVGGIIASNESAVIKNCCNTGKIVGNAYVGGLYGNGNFSTSRTSSVVNSYNAGEICGKDYVGGLAGYLTQTQMSNCNNYANVAGNTNVGALIGYSESIWGKGTVEKCYYLKDTETNTNLNAFGNAPDEIGIAEGKPKSFFPYFGNIKGDVNGDNNITAIDARWALQAASGTRELTEKQKAAVDVNGDGKITAIDARWILQAASGTRIL